MRAPVRHRFIRLLAATGLVGALLLPAQAVPALAADPLVLRAGTDQKIKSLNPYTAVVVAEYEAFTLNYDLLVNFGENNEPVPGFAASWTQSTDGNTWTFKIQPGMKWSDGTPATSEDVRWTYQMMLDAYAAELTLGSGYLDGYLPAAGVTSVTAPDPETVVITTEFPSTLILYVYAPILPKHVWEKVPVDDIASGTFTNPPPVVGTGPYQAVETTEGNFTRFVKNPNWRGDPLGPDEVVITTFASSDTMVQALRNGEIDYARGIQPDQFTALAGQADIVTVEGASNGYTELAFNCYTRNGGVIEGGGASTKAAPGPGLPRRTRLRHRQGGARREGPRRLRRPRRHDRPALPCPLVRPADEPAHVRHREGEVASRRGGLPARRRRPPSRQGRQADHPPSHLAGLGGGERDRGPVPRGLVRAARHQGRRLGHRGRPAHRPAPARRRPRGRPTSTCSSGAGWATRTRTPC